MLVNVCLLLRIVLHYNQTANTTFSVQHVSVTQCQAANEYPNYVNVDQSSAKDSNESHKQEFVEELNPPLSSLWIYQPATYVSLNTDVFHGNKVIPKPPYLITRLAKSLNAGFDPYFNKTFKLCNELPAEVFPRDYSKGFFKKGVNRFLQDRQHTRHDPRLPRLLTLRLPQRYFQPFERRSKPITLIAFRKHGLMPRKNVYVPESDNNTIEVAEMQSSYNTPIGDF